MTTLEIKDKYGVHVVFISVKSTNGGVNIIMEQWKTEIKRRFIPYKRGVLLRIRDHLKHPDNLCNEKNWFDARVINTTNEYMKYASDMTVNQEKGMADKLRETEIYDEYFNKSLQLIKPVIRSDFTKSLM
jgi:hypothetical protein